jgi:YegS/Rv2252/BmrU family lipid kinase
MGTIIIRMTSGIKHVAIVANPIAGRGKVRPLAQAIADQFNALGVQATLLIDEPAEARADGLARAEAVVAMGGDGTLRAVAARCLQLRGDIPPLLPVPMGTANLMARYLGIDWPAADLPGRVVQSVRRGQTTLLDAAQANGELFLLMAGIGLDAQIVHHLDRLRKGPINYASYVIPAAMTFAGYQYSPLRVRVDGVEAFGMSPGVAFVANVKEYGTGFALVPGARPDDGLLDVCVIPVTGRADALRHFLHAAAGEHLLGEDVVYVRGKQIDIESSEPLPVQIDGEPAGHTPVHIDLLPLRVPFIVPG